MRLRFNCLEIERDRNSTDCLKTFKQKLRNSNKHLAKPKTQKLKKKNTKTKQFSEVLGKGGLAKSPWELYVLLPEVCWMFLYCLNTIFMCVWLLLYFIVFLYNYLSIKMLISNTPPWRVVLEFCITKCGSKFFHKNIARLASWHCAWLLNKPGSINIKPSHYGVEKRNKKATFQDPEPFCSYWEQIEIHDLSFRHVRISHEVKWGWPLLNIKNCHCPTLL